MNVSLIETANKYGIYNDHNFYWSNMMLYGLEYDKVSFVFTEENEIIVFNLNCINHCVNKNYKRKLLKIVKTIYITIREKILF